MTDNRSGLTSAASGYDGSGGEPRLRPAKVSEIVARQIVADIVEADLGPGDRLASETAMLERYRVGRSSLREALRLLEVSGLLRMRMGAGGGPEVADRSGAQLGRSMRLHFQTMGVTFRHVVTARRSLEPLLAREAAEHGSPDLKARLLDLAHGHATRDGEVMSFSAASREFHDLLSAQTASNPILGLFVRAVSQVYAELVRTRGPRSVREDHQQVDAEHVAIAEAISRGDGNAAEQLMEAHLDGLADYLDGQYAMSLDDVVEWD